MEKVIEYLEKINNMHNEFLKEMGYENIEKDYIIAYRGENKDFGPTTLIPSMYRNKINLESFLELIKDYGISESSDILGQMIDAQHYVAISNLLDITFDVLVSLFFACYTNEANDFECVEKKEYKHDAWVYVFTFPIEFIGNRKLIEVDINDKRKNDEKFRKIRNLNFRIITNSSTNPRVISQSGGFIYFYSEEYPIINDVFKLRIKINKEDRGLLLDQLERLFNISYSTIYPEKENQTERIYTALNHRKDNYISNISELNESELDNFYLLLKHVINKINHSKKEKEEKFLEMQRAIRGYFQTLEVLKDDLEDDKIIKKIDDINRDVKLYALSVLKG